MLHNLPCYVGTVTTVERRKASQTFQNSVAIFLLSNDKSVTAEVLSDCRSSQRPGPRCLWDPHWVSCSGEPVNVTIVGMPQHSQHSNQCSAGFHMQCQLT
jgi:hypothetical protein